MQKEILVLAKSYKTGGFCIAGVEVDKGTDGQRRLTRRWIRPVSRQNGTTSGSIPSVACSNFSVFDLIGIDLEKHQPMAGQPENWQWPESAIHTLAPKPDRRVLHQLANCSAAIWHDPSTARDDQISAPHTISMGIEHSLMLIAPQNLVFSLELQRFGNEVRKRIFVSFTHNGQTYRRIAVTDPAIFRVFTNQFPIAIGACARKRLHHGDNYWLTLSLSPCFGKTPCHYIIAAAVIDHTGYLNRTYG